MIPPRRKRLATVDARSLGADCDTCPLDGTAPTLATLPADGRPPKITVLLDHPQEIDDLVGKAAQGQSGVFLHNVWSTLNVKREEAAVRHATMCKAPDKTSEANLKASIEACRPRLARELDGGPRGHGNTSILPRELVLVCGKHALQAVSGKTSIDDWRGFPITPNASFAAEDSGRTIYFPTYHPDQVRAKPQYYHVFRRDLRVAWDFAHGRIKPLEWPTLHLDNSDGAREFLYSICESLEAGHALDIGVDVETKGDWTTRLLLVGIATLEGSCSLLYPFADEHIDAYARFILSHPNATLVVQNGNHDALSLEKHNFRLSPKRWDTIVAGRVAYPDLPHDLGFLATLFFFINRWKSEFHSGSSNDAKGGEGWDRYLAPSRLDDFLKYNACDALSQILMKAPLEKRLAHVPRK